MKTVTEHNIRKRGKIWESQLKKSEFYLAICFIRDYTVNRSVVSYNYYGFDCEKGNNVWK